MNGFTSGAFVKGVLFTKYFVLPFFLPCSFFFDMYVTGHVLEYDLKWLEKKLFIFCRLSDLEKVKYFLEGSYMYSYVCFV